MQTEIIYTGIFDADAMADAAKICTRMGWGGDFNDSGDYVVNIPVDDMPLFDFIFGAVL